MEKGGNSHAYNSKADISCTEPTASISIDSGISQSYDNVSNRSINTPIQDGSSKVLPPFNSADKISRTDGPQVGFNVQHRLGYTEGSGISPVDLRVFDSSQQATNGVWRPWFGLEDRGPHFISNIPAAHVNPSMSDLAHIRSPYDYFPLPEKFGLFQNYAMPPTNCSSYSSLFPPMHPPNFAPPAHQHPPMMPLVYAGYCGYPRMPLPASQYDVSNPPLPFREPQITSSPWSATGFNSAVVSHPTMIQTSTPTLMDVTGSNDSPVISPTRNSGPLSPFQFPQVKTSSVRQDIKGPSSPLYECIPEKMSRCSSTSGKNIDRPPLADVSTALNEQTQSVHQVILSLPPTDTIPAMGSQRVRRKAALENKHCSNAEEKNTKRNKLSPKGNQDPADAVPAMVSQRGKRKAALESKQCSKAEGETKEQDRASSEDNHDQADAFPAMVSQRVKRKAALENKFCSNVEDKTKKHDKPCPKGNHGLDVALPDMVSQRGKRKAALENKFCSNVEDKTKKRYVTSPKGNQNPADALPAKVSQRGKRKAALENKHCSNVEDKTKKRDVISPKGNQNPDDALPAVSQRGKRKAALENKHCSNVEDKTKKRDISSPKGNQDPSDAQPAKLSQKGKRRPAKRVSENNPGSKESDDLSKRDEPLPYGNHDLHDMDIKFDSIPMTDKYCDINGHYKIINVPDCPVKKGQLRKELLELFQHSNLPKVPATLRDNVDALVLFPHMQHLLSLYVDGMDLKKLEFGACCKTFVNPVLAFMPEDVFNAVLDKMSYLGADGMMHCLVKRAVNNGAVCDHVAKEVDKMRCHLKNHYPDKKWVCCFCRAQMPNLTDMERHTSTHTVPKPFKCFQCSKLFARKVELAHHMKNLHNKDLQTVDPRKSWRCRRHCVLFREHERDVCLRHMEHHHGKSADFKNKKQRRLWPYDGM
ncbi:hypothetical protein Btru_058808 [Bulinus truncatus]|nr:hypothetical protein Btru_058808 [Bulinus truncatus]